MRNIEIMLVNGMIHGDLSAYNILYWEGEITLIDFPQVTDSRVNRQAYLILERDIKRVCEYFAAQGVRTIPARSCGSCGSATSNSTPSSKPPICPPCSLTMTMCKTVGAHERIVCP